MNPTDNMSEEERLQRIAELLSKGITLMLMREAEGRSRPTGADAKRQTTACRQAPVAGDPAGQAIVDYLFRVGTASPKQVQSNVGLTRSSACRRLGELEARGLIARNGRTRAVRYGLAQVTGGD
jgi:CRP-like cAMP-binding protein